MIELDKCYCSSIYDSMVKLLNCVMFCVIGMIDKDFEILIVGVLKFLFVILVVWSMVWFGDFIMLL